MPYQPYPGQLEIMLKTIECLENGRNLLIDSPTVRHTHLSLGLWKDIGYYECSACLGFQRRKGKTLQSGCRLANSSATESNSARAQVQDQRIYSGYGSGC